MQAAAGQAGTGEGDNTFKNVTLLIDGDAVNGDNNSTITDTAGNYTITDSSYVSKGAFSPFLPNWSVDLSGATNVLEGSSVNYSRVSTQGDYHSGQTLAGVNGEFTIEFWFKPSTLNTSYSSGSLATILDTNATQGTNSEQWWAVHQNGQNIYFDTNNASQVNSTTNPLTKVNQWYHIAIIGHLTDGVNRTIYICVNGVNAGSASYGNSIGGGASRALHIGHQTTTNRYNRCNLSNLRIVRNQAVYDPTSNFAVPTAKFALSDVPNNTMFLAFHRHDFYSEGNTPSTTDVNKELDNEFVGEYRARMSAWSPFRKDGPVTISGTGGSFGFPSDPNAQLVVSSGRSLTYGTADFTFECWVYINKWRSVFAMIAGQSTSNRYIGIDSSGRITIYAGASGSEVKSSSAANDKVRAGAWNHIVVTRYNNQLAMYNNGRRVLSPTTYNYDMGTGSDTTTIGVHSNYANFYLDGYLSNIRSVRGSAAYGNSLDTTITVPSSPTLTTFSSTTELILRAQDATILDKTGINNLVLQDDAQASSAVKKFGVGGLVFDGTGDVITAHDRSPSNYTGSYLQIYRKDPFVVRQGDATIEGWVYFTTNPVSVAGMGIFEISKQNENATNDGLALGTSPANGKWFIHADASTFTATASAPTTGQWYHFALVRTCHGGLGGAQGTKLYINGTQVITASDTTDYESTNLVIGSMHNNTRRLGGYVDDFRITMGIARYTSSGFSPPTSSHPKF